MINVSDAIYEIRSGTGVGVFAPQEYGPRRAIYASIRKFFRVSVCRRQALGSSVTRRSRRGARMEMKAIETNAMRWSFERSNIVFNRR